MLIRFFKSSYSGQYIGLLVLLTGLCLPLLLDPPQIEQSDQLLPLWDLLLILFGQSALVAGILNMLIIFISALILNHVLSFYDLIPKNSLEGAFVYVLFAATLAPPAWTGPLLFANFFFLLLINVSLKLYDEKEAYRSVFSMGFLLSLIFLLYLPLIYLIIPVYTVIVIMGNVRWRELFIPLVGFALPLLFAAVFYFMVDKFAYFAENFLHDFTSFGIIAPAYSISFWILIALAGILLLLSFFSVLGNLSAKNIDIRKKLMSLIHFLLFSFLIFLFLENEYRSITMLIAPVSGITAHYFSWRKKTKKFEIIVWLILVMGLLRNYHLIGF